MNGISLSSLADVTRATLSQEEVQLALSCYQASADKSICLAAAPSEQKRGSGPVCNPFDEE